MDHTHILSQMRVCTKKVFGARGSIDNKNAVRSEMEAAH